MDILAGIGIFAVIASLVGAVLGAFWVVESIQDLRRNIDSLRTRCSDLHNQIHRLRYPNSTKDHSVDG